MKKVLQRKYPEASKDPVVDVLKVRQESIRKQVVAHNGLWAGGAALALPCWSRYERVNC